MPRRRGEGIPTKRGADDLWRAIGEPGPGARVRGYVRYSHEEGRYGLTEEGQKAEMARYAAARGWVLQGWDVEPARSAKYDEIERRPVFAQHLEAAVRGELDVSLCYMNDRWARNVGVAVVSLSRLRRAGIWWATTDDRWNIDRIQEDGFDITWLVDCQVNAGLSRKISRKVRVGKQTRAELGFHNGDVMFGYLRPPDPPRPADAPVIWKPPRQSVIRHPERFQQLVQIGEWASEGKSDAEIASLCNAAGWRTGTTKPKAKKLRFAGVGADGEPIMAHDIVGPRPFSKDAIRVLLINPFPRAFSPTSDRGTIIAPDGKRAEGQHPAAWSWELCQRIDEARAARRGSRGQRRMCRHSHKPARVWVFSGYVVCAHCGHRLRADASPHDENLGYYRDEAGARGFICAARGEGLRGRRGTSAVRADWLERLFVELLQQLRLPQDWRARIAEEASIGEPDVDAEAEAARLDRRREALRAELERLKFQHRHGLVDDTELVRESDRLRAMLAALPDPGARKHLVVAELEAGETLERLAGYWDLATPEERAELVRILLLPEGLVYDLVARRIVGLRPRPAFLPALSMALADEWTVSEEGMLQRSEHERDRKRRGVTADKKAAREARRLG